MNMTFDISQISCVGITDGTFTTDGTNWNRTIPKDYIEPPNYTSPSYIPRMPVLPTITPNPIKIPIPYPPSVPSIIYTAPLILEGWKCPRCNKILAPFVEFCDCSEEIGEKDNSDKERVDAILVNQDEDYETKQYELLFPDSEELEKLDCDS